MFPDLIRSIKPLEESRLAEGQIRLDTLTKPRGSLGELEEIAKRLYAIYGSFDKKILSKGVFVLASDHGITEEGVSAYPQEVTSQMLLNFVQGGAAISVLARSVGAKLFVADFGVASDFSHPDVIQMKIGRGTRNFLREDAMSRAQAAQAIAAGYDLFTGTHETHHFDLVAFGDMGIGNSTSAAALTAAFTGKKVLEITGNGTGVSEEAKLKKIRVIEESLRARKPNPSDTIDVLAKLGGFEIVGLVGMHLAAARLRVPVIIDGLISSVAALAAARIAPQAASYFFASHQSEEPAHKVILDELKLKPLINGRMRLGEASGAALAMPLIENAWRLMTEMATFESGGVSKSVSA